MLDDNPITGVELVGPSGWVQLELGGGDGALEVDRMDVFARAWSFSKDTSPWTCVILGSNDGTSWAEVARTEWNFERAGSTVAVRREKRGRRFPSLPRRGGASIDCS